jgi:hypothetical protein
MRLTATGNPEERGSLAGLLRPRERKERIFILSGTLIQSVAMLKVPSGVS